MYRPMISSVLCSLLRLSLTVVFAPTSPDLFIYISFGHPVPMQFRGGCCSACLPTLLLLGMCPHQRLARHSTGAQCDMTLCKHTIICCCRKFIVILLCTEVHRWQSKLGVCVGDYFFLQTISQD